MFFCCCCNIKCEFGAYAILVDGINGSAENQSHR